MMFLEVASRWSSGDMRGMAKSEERRRRATMLVVREGFLESTSSASFAYWHSVFVRVCYYFIHLKYFNCELLDLTLFRCKSKKLLLY